MIKLLLIFQLLFIHAICQAQTANDFFTQQQYAKALTLLQDMDTTVANLSMKATCESRLGLLKEAKKSYLQILNQDSTNLSAIAQLGSIYDQEYDLPKAIRYYRQLIQIDSTNSYYYKINAQLAIKAGLKSEAFLYFAHAHRLNPKDIGVLRDLSELFLANDQLEEADSLLHLAYLQDTTSLQTIMSKAKMEYTKKEYAEAVRFLLKTKGRIDLNPYYQKMLGYSFLQIDSFDLAISHLEKLLHEESNEYTHYYLATAYSKKEQWENAIYHFDLAIKDAISPNLFVYHANLGDIYTDLHQNREALKQYEEAYRYKPDPKYIFFKARLADEYYKDKQIAINQYNRYLKTKHFQKEWNDYARKRVLYLKELKHLSNK